MALLRNVFLTAVAALFSAQSVAGASGNAFINPVPAGYSDTLSTNPAYQDGQVLDIAWQVNYSPVDLLLWQPAMDNSVSHLFSNRTVSSYLWTIDVSDFTTDGTNTSSGIPYSVFYLAIYPTGATSASRAFASRRFNVTNISAINSGSPTTTYLPSASTSSASNDGGSASSAQAYGTDDETSGLGQSGRLALGFGLGLGLPLLISVGIIGYLLGRRRSSRRSNAQQAEALGAVSRAPAPQYQGGAGGAAASSQNPQPQQRLSHALVEHYGPQDSVTEHYSPAQSPIQHAQAPATQQAALPTKQIVTARYQ